MVFKIMAFFFVFSYAVIEAKESYGPFVVSRVTKVYDGDTITVDIDELNPLAGKKIGVRILGIDTPEIRSKDPEVKAMAYEVRDWLLNKIKNAKRVELKNVQRDKYFRILADVYVDGEKVANEMLEKKLAIPYDGGKKADWSLFIKTIK